MAFHWYAVETKPNCERKALVRIKSQEFEAWLPQMVGTRLNRFRRPYAALVPFFPRYLFVHFDRDDDRWVAIKSTIGVLRMVLDGKGNPRQIPDGWIESLIRRADENDGRPPKPGEDQLPVPDRWVKDFDRSLERQRARDRRADPYDEGQAVRVVDGPFQSFSGTYDGVEKAERFDPVRRLAVWINIFGRPTRVVLDETQLAAAS